MINNIVIINDFGYIQGGASQVAIETANLLAKSKKYNIYFFTGDIGEFNLLDSNIIIISTEQKESLLQKNKFFGIINGLYNVKASRKLKSLLNELDRTNTVIHIHGWTKCLSCSIFKIIFQFKFLSIITCHDYFTICPNGGLYNYNINSVCKIKPMTFQCVKCNCDSRNYYFKLYRVVRQIIQNNLIKLIKKTQNVITISEFSEKILMDYWEKGTNIFRVYNPISVIDVQNSILEKDYYLYVGRISKEKGVELYCDMITKLNLKGIVVGDGCLKKELEKKYDNIKFVGWKNRNSVLSYMKNANALVFPSKWYETAGLTVLEAHSVGTPCIVSNICAATEFCTKYDYIFDINNKNDLIYQTKKLLNEDISHSDFLKKSIYKFKDEIYLNELMKIYDKVGGSKK